jgi:hypothetical protein
MSKCSPQAVLSWACALLQSASSLEPPLRHRPLPGSVRRCGSSHEVCSPSACPRSRQQHRGWVCLTRPLAPTGFRNLSTRFDPPRACRPCFMPDPLMGLHPSELCSHHVAVRRLRRRSPLGVGPCSSPSRHPAPVRTREGRSLLEPGQPRPFRQSRSPARPNQLPPIPSEPKPRRADRSSDPRAPKRPSSQTVALLSERRSAFRAERSPDPPAPKHRRVEPRPPLLKSPEAPLRVERPLDPQEPKPLWMRRPARTARARRVAWFGHRSVLREPEGPLRPDRSLSSPRPKPLRVLSGAETPSSPLRDRGPFESSDPARAVSQPKPRHNSGGRSPAIPEPELRSHQTSDPFR